ncbi:MAG: tRNA (N6-threonylcarbamoyladenosine(37)-N6)-methyltransferase TrmO [Bacteroidales bacterium]|nr:tRNA (N6-threonylcarbamoyladenosine(37)-N6)-methyltransferase TrmO [Bacteroidales bacterium]
MEVIAHIFNDFDTKFGVPRQSGVVSSLRGRIVFEKEYRVREAFRGLDEFSHIWLLWDFSEAHKEKWSPTVRPPRLGGNQRMGVFATRSPFRPNNIGLSSVRLLTIDYNDPEGPVLIVEGADLMNNTPIFDVKPYLRYTDCHEDATGGFTSSSGDEMFRLKVEMSDEVSALLHNSLSDIQMKALVDILSNDPRPHYKKDGDKDYVMEYAGNEIRFSVSNGIVTIIGIGV